MEWGIYCGLGRIAGGEDQDFLFMSRGVPTLRWGVPFIFM